MTKKIEKLEANKPIVENLIAGLKADKEALNDDNNSKKLVANNVNVHMQLVQARKEFRDCQFRLKKMR
jgi:hypothetical protein